MGDRRWKPDFHKPLVISHYMAVVVCGLYATRHIHFSRALSFTFTLYIISAALSAVPLSSVPTVVGITETCIRDDLLSLKGQGAKGTQYIGNIQFAPLKMSL